MRILAENKRELFKEQANGTSVLNSPDEWECPEQPCSVFCIIKDKPEVSNGMCYDSLRIIPIITED